MAEPINFVTEHFDVVKIALTGSLGYIVWSLRKGLQSFELTMKEIQGDLKAIVLQVTTLQAEHNVRVQSITSCNLDSCIHHHRRLSDHQDHTSGE